MAKRKPPRPATAKPLILDHETALKICEKHGHRQVAERAIASLSYRADLGTLSVSALVKDQISGFAGGLVNCVERARVLAGKVEELSGRAEQGAALREIRRALENLSDVIERAWDLAGQDLKVETAEQLGRLLTTQATKDLLPARPRLEYIELLENRNDDQRQRLKLSYLLKAGCWPLIELIKGAKIAVRRAEGRVRPGPPLKAPLEMALVMQLADHFEWALSEKAAGKVGGPFSRFCADVFDRLGLEWSYDWEHLLREGLKLYRSSFGARRRHERQGAMQTTDGPPHKRRPRKQNIGLLPVSRTLS